jgi:uncharacterized protein YbjT (DUF2867 family)
MKELILVTGATGLQGGAVARSLLKKGYWVRALTRHPKSQKAKELAKMGAFIFAGDFNHPKTLVQAMHGVDIVFAMGTPHKTLVEIELENGIALADAASKAGVSFYIYSSVANADRNTGIPQFESKMEIEKHIRLLELPHAIVAPVFFMENILGPAILPSLRKGSFSQPLPGNINLQMLSVYDLAEFVSYMIEKRDDFLNKRINLAADELTGIEVANIISKLSHQKIAYNEIPLEEIKASSINLALMYQWFNEIGYSIIIPQVKHQFPTINWHTFKDWATAQDWNILKKNHKLAA